MDIRDKKITLSEALDRLPKTCIVKVGSSSSFFYCYYNDKYCKARISKESDRYLNALKRSVAKKQDEYRNLDSKEKSILDKLKNSKTYKGKARIEKREEVKTRYANKRNNLPKEIELAQKKVDNFIPFLDRYCREIYQINMPVYENPNTYYLMITGRESGRFIDIREYALARNLPMKKGDDCWSDKLSQKHNKAKKKTGSSKKVRR